MISHHHARAFVSQHGFVPLVVIPSMMVTEVLPGSFLVAGFSKLQLLQSTFYCCLEFLSDSRHGICGGTN